MTQVLGTIRPEDRVYARSTARRSFMDSAARRAAQALARKTRESPARVNVKPMAAAPLAKPAPGFAGARNAGPTKSRNARQNAPARPMNTHRGARSR
jgi:hypothetical protein